MQTSRDAAERVFCNYHNTYVKRETRLPWPLTKTTQAGDLNQGNNRQDQEEEQETTLAASDKGHDLHTHNGQQAINTKAICGYIHMLFVISCGKVHIFA